MEETKRTAIYDCPICRKEHKVKALWTHEATKSIAFNNLDFEKEAREMLYKVIEESFKSIHPNGVFDPLCVRWVVDEDIWVRPEDADRFGWYKFIAYALENGISSENYGPWWQCWKEAWKAAEMMAGYAFIDNQISKIEAQKEEEKKEEEKQIPKTPALCEVINMDKDLGSDKGK